MAAIQAAPATGSPDVPAIIQPSTGKETLAAAATRGARHPRQGAGGGTTSTPSDPGSVRARYPGGSPGGPASQPDAVRATPAGRPERTIQSTPEPSQVIFPAISPRSAGLLWRRARRGRGPVCGSGGAGRTGKGGGRPAVPGPFNAPAAASRSLRALRALHALRDAALWAPSPDRLHHGEDGARPGERRGRQAGQEPPIHHPSPPGGARDGQGAGNPDTGCLTVSTRRFRPAPRR